MNRSLLKAAAVLNIAIASLIYVSCSGDDGKDGANGKDGCLVALNPANGKYDITCGGQFIVAIDPTGAVAGESCRAEPTSYGVDIICGNGPAYPLRNGTDGTGGTGGSDCWSEVGEITAPSAGTQLYGDKAIQIRCLDGRSASILVCPSVIPTAPFGSTGLLFNVDGQLGRCTAEGLIVRTEQKTRNCGGTLFDIKKEFCQRTLAKRTTPANSSINDSGHFAIYSATAAAGVVEGAYPTTFTGIDDPESAYNKAGENPNVKSTVLPLCGTPIADSNNPSDIESVHKSGSGNAQIGLGANVVTVGVTTVYNALQHCGRNLVFKTGTAAAGNTSDRYSNNNRIIPGGQLDNNSLAPNSKAWSVQENGNCYVGLAETNVITGQGARNAGINGFTFTGTPSQDRANGSCTFFGAVQSAAPPTYSTCPPDKPLVGLDDVGCKARSECLFHSTVDNTCLISNQQASLFGGEATTAKYDSADAVIEVTFVSGDKNTYSVESGFYTLTKARGIYRTLLGSRDGRGTKAGGNVTLERDGNIWSTVCQTSSRSSFYAVNDPYLTNKKWKDSLEAAIWNLGANDILDLEAKVGPPVCAKFLFSAKDSSIAPVPFDDAFACLKGILSVYKTETAQSNDGSAFDKPIYCVQSEGWDGVDVPDPSCYVSGGGVTRDNCELISKVFTTTDVALSDISVWDAVDGVCNIGDQITKTTCDLVTQAYVPSGTPYVLIPGTIPNPSYPNATRGGLATAWIPEVPGVPGPPAVLAVPGYCKISFSSGTTITKGICDGVRRVKHVTGGDIPVTSTWTAAGDICAIKHANGSTSLEAVCPSIEWVTGSDVSVTAQTPVSAQWK